MNYELQTEINIDGVLHKIRNNGDYRVILDVICALNDFELSDEERLQAALYIFYDDINNIRNFEIAAKEMMVFINDGEIEEEENTEPPIMDWQQDFKLMVAPINRVLGCEIRSIPYLHWWTFLGGYKEIGEGTFQTVISIRQKRRKHQKLEKWEEEFYRENRKMIDLPLKLTPEEQEFLNSD